MLEVRPCINYNLNNVKLNRDIKKILLVNPPSLQALYKGSRITAAVPKLPAQAIGILSGVLLKEGFDVKPLDLLLEKEPYQTLRATIEEFSPDAVGVSFITPLHNEVAEIARVTKGLKPDCFMIAGGPHATALPEDTLNSLDFDAVVIGEGEITLPELLRADNLSNIKGIAFKDDGQVLRTEPRELISDLDTLPLPAWHLFNVNGYRASRITSRRNPIGSIVTGRGCVYPCSFCDRSVFGKTFRKKSPSRVIEELEYLMDCGFKEVHFLDDMFTMDMDHAKDVCRLILKSGMDFTINLCAGLRVDRVEKELFGLLKDAGCYTVSFGVESGNEEILKRNGKNFSLDQCREAFALAREAGLERVGFFMLGFPEDTVETMKQTIDFAVELNPTYAKVSKVVPYPSTRIFTDLEARGLIISKDWSQYHYHASENVWEHPNLSWDEIKDHYYQFYKRFYLRPSYVMGRLKRGILRGDPFFDAYYAVMNFIR